MRGCPDNVIMFGRELHVWLQRHPRFRFIINSPIEFVPGGCWFMAEALHEWLGPDSELWSVLDADKTVHHVVVKVGKCFIDAWGAATGKELIEGWREEGGLVGPDLQPLDREKAAASGLECASEGYYDLIEALNKRFNSDDILRWAGVLTE